MTVDQLLDDHEHDLEHGHLDPAADEQLDAVQQRYERAIGWAHD